jgi:hypothetical protein
MSEANTFAIVVNQQQASLLKEILSQTAVKIRSARALADLSDSVDSAVKSLGEFKSDGA